MFQPGDYVRHNFHNLGTGQVTQQVAIRELGPDDKIISRLVFTVKWLEQNGQMSQETTDTIAASARNVPQFNSIEEADAWMEAQRSGGAWTAAAEDANATVATILDQTAAEVAAQAAASVDTRCGGTSCGCQDCVQVEHPIDPRMLLHVGSCNCEERGCPCATA